MTENGLFEKAKQSNKEYDISQAKEKLNMKIMEFKASSIDNETLEQFRDYLLEDVSDNLYKIKEEYENNDLTSTIKALNITDVESGYTFLVDESLNITNIQSGYFTEATYEIISIEENKYNIKITVSNLSGIQKIQSIKGNIIDCNNKTNIGIDCQVEKDKEYQIKVYSQNDKEEILTLNTCNINSIIIEDTDSYAYPIITASGVKIGKSLNIKYAQESQNYYSLDDGNTWIEYSDNLNILKEGIIKAKSVIENQVVQIVSKNIQLQLANDALGSNAYDENDETYIEQPSGYMLVDYNIIGEKLYINQNENYLFVYFYDNENNLLETVRCFQSDPYVTIKEKTARIGIGYIYSDTLLYEIRTVYEPIINFTNIYPRIKVNTVEGEFGNFTIENKKLYKNIMYKIDNEDWKIYNGDFIKLLYEETIYAKGILNDNTETYISSYKYTKTTSSPGINFYDGKEETYTNKPGKFLIDSEVIGKKIYIKHSENYVNVCCYDLDGNLIQTYKCFQSDPYIIVPNNTDSIVIYDVYSDTLFYEIKVVNE